MYQLFVHELSLSKFLVLCSTTGCLRRTYLFFISCISWYPCCLNPTVTVLHYLRIPGLWQPLGIPAQFFHWVLLDFLMTFLLEIWTYIEPWCWFLASWIGPSFVKIHGLSLLFMEWAFLWNFGPQQNLIAISFVSFEYLCAKFFLRGNLCAKSIHYTT